MWANVIIALFTVITGGAAIWQGCSTERSLTLTRKSYNDSVAAGKQANEDMQRQLCAMEGMVDATKDSVHIASEALKLQERTEAARRSLEVLQRGVAQRQLEAAEPTIELTVAVGGIVINGDRTMRGTVNIRNGSVVAAIEPFSFLTTVDSIGEITLESFEDLRGSASYELAPGGARAHWSAGDGKPITEEDAASIKSGKGKKIAFYGQVVYSSTRPRSDRHCKRFCWYYPSLDNAAVMCPRHNGRCE